MRRWNVGILEDFLHGETEFLSDPVGQIKGRIVFSGFQRVDRLPRNADPFSQFFLRPAAFATELFELVCHQWEVFINGVTKAKDTIRSG